MSRYMADVEGGHRSFEGTEVGQRRNKANEMQIKTQNIGLSPQHSWIIHQGPEFRYELC